MIVDNLKSCYVTRMRVRLQPELIATVRWYWAPPGALPLPGETAFGSSVWETPDREYPQPDLGEIDLARTWNKGATPPGVTGQGTPTPLSWYVDGVPASVTASYPNPPCVVPRWFELWAWLRPQSLPTGTDPGSTISTWADSSPYQLPWITDLVHGHPTLVQDGTDPRCGLPYTAWFANKSNLALDTYLARNGNGNDTVAGMNLTTFLVAKLDTVSPGALLNLGGASGGAVPIVGPVTFECNVGSPPARHDGPQPAGWHVWATRVTAAGSEVWLDGVKVGFPGGPPSPGFTLGHLGTGISFFGPDSGFAWVSEVLVYQVALTDNELRYVFDYLKPLVCPPAPLPPAEEDVLIGSITMDSGTDAVPAKYLLCNGQAVSRTTYSALFARIGTTYGAGDGSTTFNVPNLLGKVLYGSGGAYTTGQAVGNDAPVMAAGQLPAHSHPITQTAHVHGPPASLINFLGEVFAGGTYATPPAGTTIKGTSPVNGSTVNITVDNNTPSGSPLDVRQAGVAVRPLIYAGV